MDNLKSDYLILLVGTNPIPNYISAFAFAKQKSCIYLVHTTADLDGAIGTESIASNIKRILIEKEKDVDVRLVKSDKSNGNKINSIFNKILDEISLDKSFNGKTIHINYTGGTKAMASHGYFKLKDYEKRYSDKFKYIYSYIDSEKNSVIYEINGQFFAISLDDISNYVNPKIHDICSIHGFTIDDYTYNGEIDGIEVIKNSNISRKENTSNEKFNFKAVYRQNFNIYCLRETENTRNSECKMDLFILKDNADKIFGDQTKLCLVSDIEDKENLSQEVDDFYRTKISRNIKIIAHNDDMDQEVIKWIKGR